MDDRDATADLQEWELLLASPTATAAPGPYAGGGEAVEDDAAGAIKHDYFDLGSDNKYARRASLSAGAEEEDKEEEGTDEEAGEASWVEPHPGALSFPARDRAALWSDSSSDGERREDAEATEPLVETPREATAAGADEGAVAKGGAAAAARWWKLPVEVLRLWAARAARSAWSVPVAVALLGIAVLGRRLYRMRRQSKAVARVRLVLDDKKASQFKAHPMLRRAPMIKPMLPTNGVTPWPVLGHL